MWTLFVTEVSKAANGAQRLKTLYTAIPNLINGSSGQAMKSLTDLISLTGIGTIPGAITSFLIDQANKDEEEYLKKYASPEEYRLATAPWWQSNTNSYNGGY